jgi:hypothetical protein
MYALAENPYASSTFAFLNLRRGVSHAAWPQIKMQEHKTARMTQEQQSLASGALLGQLQFSVSARPASGGCRLKKEKNDACS